MNSKSKIGHLILVSCIIAAMQLVGCSLQETYAEPENETSSLQEDILILENEIPSLDTKVIPTETIATPNEKVENISPITIVPISPSIISTTKLEPVYVPPVFSMNEPTIYNNNNNNDNNNNKIETSETRFERIPTTLRIIVNLQARPQKPDNTWIIPVEVWLHAPGALWTETANNGALHYYNTFTSNTGEIDITVPSGTYDIRVKGRTTLKVKASNISINESGTTEVYVGELIEGDVTGDNIIDEFDYSGILMYFGYETNLPETPFYAQRCDFNNDGCVDETDFSIVVANFGQGGADIQ